MGTDNKEPVMLTIEETAKALGVCKGTVANLIKKGKLKTTKARGKKNLLLHFEDVEDYKSAESISVRDLATRLVKLERTVQGISHQLQDITDSIGPSKIKKKRPPKIDPDMVKSLIERILS